MPPPAPVVGEGVEVAAVRKDVVPVGLCVGLQRRLLLLLVGDVILVGGAAPANVETREKGSMCYVLRLSSVIRSVGVKQNFFKKSMRLRVQA